MIAKSAARPRDLMNRWRSKGTLAIFALMFSGRSRRCIAEGAKPSNDIFPSLTLLSFSDTSASANPQSGIPLPTTVLCAAARQLPFLLVGHLRRRCLRSLLLFFYGRKIT